MEYAPVLVTLTSPTAAGKSYLFNHIRDVAKLPCLISTTTRPPRAGEREGVDYFFISEEESHRLEAEGEFAELAIYRGVRYGVTKSEFHNKLSQGIAFLIVEPSGIDHYARPALDAGAEHLKFYIHTDPDVRQTRFMQRAMDDFDQELMRYQLCEDNTAIKKLFKSYMDRQRAVSTTEMQWGQAANWDRILFGTEKAESNLSIILDTVAKHRALKHR